MIKFLRVSLVALCLSAPVVFTALAAEPDKPGAEKKAAPTEVCEHGVKKSICTRCNPKLEALFRSKNDWCEEHKRAESQCVLCHPELAKKGIK